MSAGQPFASVTVYGTGLVPGGFGECPAHGSGAYPEALRITFLP